MEDILKSFHHTSQTIKDDFIDSTDYMIDLVRPVCFQPRVPSETDRLQMYKSISIRDSRQSLELNASLWRLSWITFIFLPLTFLVGFFGMVCARQSSYYCLFTADRLGQERRFFQQPSIHVVVLGRRGSDGESYKE